MFRKRQDFNVGLSTKIVGEEKKEVAKKIGDSKSIVITTSKIDLTDLDVVRSLGDYREGSLEELLKAKIPVEKVNTVVLGSERIDNVQEKVTKAISKKVKVNDVQDNPTENVE